MTSSSGILTRAAANRLRNNPNKSLEDERKLTELGKGLSTERKRENKTVIERPAKKRITEEEKQLDGAPESFLVDAVVLPSNEITVSEDPAKEMDKVLQLIKTKTYKKVEHWSDAYFAITSLRRMLIHHEDLIVPHMLACVPLIQFAVASLRSAMARNGVLCIYNLFSIHLPEPESMIHAFVPILLVRTASEKKFLRNVSSKTLAMVVDKYASRALLDTLYDAATHKNPQIRQNVGLHAEKCITALYDGPCEVPETELEADVKNLADLTTCRSSEGRKATKRSLACIYKKKGKNPFLNNLSGSLRDEILHDLEQKPKASTSRGMSLKERILQAKKGPASSA